MTKILTYGAILIALMAIFGCGVVMTLVGVSLSSNDGDADVEALPTLSSMAYGSAGQQSVATAIPTELAEVQNPDRGSALTQMQTFDCGQTVVVGGIDIGNNGTIDHIAIVAQNPTGTEYANMGPSIYSGNFTGNGYQIVADGPMAIIPFEENRSNSLFFSHDGSVSFGANYTNQTVQLTTATGLDCSGPIHFAGGQGGGSAIDNPLPTVEVAQVITSTPVPSTTGQEAPPSGDNCLGLNTPLAVTGQGVQSYSVPGGTELSTFYPVDTNLRVVAISPSNGPDGNINNSVELTYVGRHSVIVGQQCWISTVSSNFTGQPGWLKYPQTNLVIREEGQGGGRSYGDAGPSGLLVGIRFPGAQGQFVDNQNGEDYYLWVINEGASFPDNRAVFQYTEVDDPLNTEFTIPAGAKLSMRCTANNEHQVVAGAVSLGEGIKIPVSIQQMIENCSVDVYSAGTSLDAIHYDMSQLTLYACAIDATAAANRSNEVFGPESTACSAIGGASAVRY